ncbi:uncharacterized protein PAC_02547 [Phialocephala subalpina]|uniref:Azaphilone pigments biosynthesis cluster protein L N-terminal domain-containing protein n=1 Tax=Phialocephala subalpina TaxID=576137 RepID=A0A1L7WIU1_9HELO|nr:uncharacterized protein PAC_02547 [Phialocephala subalpina]
MDPLSITTGCLALISAVGKTTIAINDFIRSCREAKNDLATITKELSELQTVLQLLKDNCAIVDEQENKDRLKAQILSIIANCNNVLLTIERVLKGLTGRTGTIKWVAFGKKEVAGLRVSLEAHRGSLNLAVQLFMITMSKATKDDTSIVRTGIMTISADTSQIPCILEELVHLRTLVMNAKVPLAMQGENYALEKNLNGLVSYADAVSDDTWEYSEDDSKQAKSWTSDDHHTRSSVQFFNRDIDEDCHRKMSEIIRNGDDIIWVAFCPGGKNRWSILCKSGHYHNHNIPEECHQAMYESSKSGAEVTRVAFTPSGQGWSILNNRGDYMNHRIPDECHDKMGELSHGGAKIISVAFPSGRQDSWSIANDKGGYFNRNIPDECHEKMGEMSRDGRSITCVAFTGKDGRGWTVSNDRGEYFNRNIPDEAHMLFGYFAQICGPVRVVAFDPNGGGWSVIASVY